MYAPLLLNANVPMVCLYICNSNRLHITLLNFQLTHAICVILNFEEDKRLQLYRCSRAITFFFIQKAAYRVSNTACTRFRPMTMGMH